MKLVYEKNRVSLKEREQKIKLGLEIRLETKIRNLLQQAKMIKQKKNAGIYWDKKEKRTLEKMRIRLEEINQKVLAKEGRLKIYRERVKQY